MREIGLHILALRPLVLLLRLTPLVFTKALSLYHPGFGERTKNLHRSLNAVAWQTVVQSQAVSVFTYGGKHRPRREVNALLLSIRVKTRLGACAECGDIASRIAADVWATHREYFSSMNRAHYLTTSRSHVIFK